MKSNILFNKETLFIIILFLFSLSINQYYGNQGVFPVDSFSHFDTGLWGFKLGMSISNLGPEVKFQGEGLEFECDDVTPSNLNVMNDKKNSEFFSLDVSVNL